jgi:hypothetical protein
MATPSESDWRRWEWRVVETFNPRYDADASSEGLSYYCEIQGPFCGYDAVGKQSWSEFLALGPPTNIEMPSDIADQIRRYATERNLK